MTKDEKSAPTPEAELRRLEERIAREALDHAARERTLLLGYVTLHDGFQRLDQAVLKGDPSDDVRQVLDRFALLRKKVESLLEKEGVVRVNSLGQPVNPELHEVVETRACHDGETAGTIVAVEEEAYLYKGDVLRMGRVVVGE